MPSPSSLDSPSSENTQLANHTSPQPHIMQQEQQSQHMHTDDTSLEKVEHHSDQVLDMFLQQVNDYSAQQLPFDDTMTVDLAQALFFSSNTVDKDLMNESTTNDLSRLPLSSSSLLGLQDQFNLQQQGSPTSSYLSSPSSSSIVAGATTTIPIQQQGASNNSITTNSNFNSSSKNDTFSTFTRNSSNQKTKEGSSLLHANFLTQAAVQGQHGLLGFKDVNKANNNHLLATTSPNNLMLGDQSMVTMEKTDCPWHVKVLGLPCSGAKSRVETQIKICIQLTNSSGELATNWSHLKLPEHMVARDKLKKRNTSKHTGDIQDRPPLMDSKTLKLEAAVVCDGHADNEIIMCSSCVHRERKRTKRKHDNKVTRAANKEGGAAKLAALFANDLPDLSSETVMAEERTKILIFNCSEYMDFSNGEATLPTRVTCYCRHHNEKVGFRIVFTIKDYNNHVLGTGKSPPIMITDDHKSPKVLTGISAPQPASLSSITDSRKRSRNDDDVKRPASSKRKVTRNGDVDSDSGVSSPVTSTPTTPLSNNGDTPVLSIDRRHQHSSKVSGNSDQQFKSQNDAVLDKSPGESSSTTFGIQQDELYEFLNSSNLLARMNSDMNQHQQSHQPQQQQYMMKQQQPYTMNHRRTSSSAGVSQQRGIGGIMNDVYNKMFQQRRTTESSIKISLPRLHRLIPSEGPIYGGSEVTVLGSNFYEGLTCLFGENPAIPTHCWSANTLLCILPPAATAGPVVVSFKEHPLMLEGQDVVLFTYFDESDRALMELALQVVGLKTLGKVEDARQIAMRIVQGNNNSHRKHKHKSSHSSRSETRSLVTVCPTRRFSYRHYLTAKAAQATYDNAHMLFYTRLEEQVIGALLAANTLSTRVDDAPRLWVRNCMSLTNQYQHTLLHLAAIRGYDRLVRVLVYLECDVDQTDRNGFTALHFASWTGKAGIVKTLLDKTDWRIETVNGKTAWELASDAGHHHVVALFQDMYRLKQHHQQEEFASPPHLLGHKRSFSNTSSLTRATYLSTTTTTTIVRIPLIDIIPSSAAVSSAKSILPEQLFNALSSLYIVSTNTPCIQQLTQSVSTVYTSMLDPF
ncbi:hypothetical protein BC941DRAFT_468459 [Chlamydoabsidia padenii]|nr:hypothetical protein BC941DRAFT_468459 [Chlamydoabsidia padenii]